MDKLNATETRLKEALSVLVGKEQRSGESSLGRRFTLMDLKGVIRESLLDRLSNDRELMESLNEQIAQGRVRVVGVRMEKGPVRHRLYEIVRRPTPGYALFSGLLRERFSASGKRFTAEKALALQGLPKDVSLEQVELWLVRMVRDHKIRAVGFDRRNDVLFTFARC